MKIEVEFCKEEDAEEWEKGGGDWYNVYGIEEGNDETWALDFTSWPEWLGMDITEKTLKEIPELAILASVLYEITYHGYSSGDLEEARKVLMDRVKEIQEDIDEK